MRTGIIGIAFAAALLVAGAIAVGVHSSATAGNADCPSGRASTGAAHANPRPICHHDTVAYPDRNTIANTYAQPNTIAYPNPDACPNANANAYAHAHAHAHAHAYPRARRPGRRHRGGG